MNYYRFSISYSMPYTHQTCIIYTRVYHSVCLMYHILGHIYIIMCHSKSYCLSFTYRIRYSISYFMPYMYNKFIIYIIVYHIECYICIIYIIEYLMLCHIHVYVSYMHTYTYPTSYSYNI